MQATQLPRDLASTVRHALDEDLGSGDITALLIPSETQASARIISRQEAVLCGRDWATEVFRQLSSASPGGDVELKWHAEDGDSLSRNQRIATLSGQARLLLTGERCALNFLQTLSGTATISSRYARLVSHTDTRLLDTRKTIPGLRSAQKYAVTVGGCHNHRMGLYDAFLIKENHIRACGSITDAVSAARALYDDRKIEVEVENLQQLEEAIRAGAEVVMLDNFDLGTMREAVRLSRGRVELEASGGITESRLAAIAETGVDFISIGALTKDCQAVDLSMLFE